MHDGCSCGRIFLNLSQGGRWSSCIAIHQSWLTSYSLEFLCADASRWSVGICISFHTQVLLFVSSHLPHTCADDSEFACACLEVKQMILRLRPSASQRFRRRGFPAPLFQCVLQTDANVEIGNLGIHANPDDDDKFIGEFVTTQNFPSAKDLERSEQFVEFLSDLKLFPFSTHFNTAASHVQWSSGRKRIIDYGCVSHNNNISVISHSSCDVIPCTGFRSDHIAKVFVVQFYPYLDLGRDDSFVISCKRKFHVGFVKNWVPVDAEIFNLCFLYTLQMLSEVSWSVDSTSPFAVIDAAVHEFNPPHWQLVCSDDFVPVGASIPNSYGPLVDLAYGSLVDLVMLARDKAEHTKNVCDRVCPWRIKIFTDGSAKQQKAEAGWGIYVEMPTINDDGTVNEEKNFRESYHGPVVCEEDHEKFVGANAVTNNSGELCAMVHALKFLLQNGGCMA